MKSQKKNKRLTLFIVFAAIIFAGLFFGFNFNNTVDDLITILVQEKDKPEENEIWMDKLTFIPKMKIIKLGTKITWVNKETAMHTIITGTPEEKSGLFESKTLGEGGEFSFTFEEKGIYKYYCGTHEDMMTGVIIVK